jgi:hypothetical protein
MLIAFRLRPLTNRDHLEILHKKESQRKTWYLFYRVTCRWAELLKFDIHFSEYYSNFVPFKDVIISCLNQTPTNNSMVFYQFN